MIFFLWNHFFISQQTIVFTFILISLLELSMASKMSCEIMDPITVIYSTSTSWTYKSRQCHSSDWADEFNGRAVMDVTISDCKLLRFTLIVIHCKNIKLL